MATLAPPAPTEAAPAPVAKKGGRKKLIVVVAVLVVAAAAAATTSTAPTMISFLRPPFAAAGAAGASVGTGGASVAISDLLLRAGRCAPPTGQPRTTSGPGWVG